MSNKEPLNVVENNNLNQDELWYRTIQVDTIESYQNYVIIFPEGKKAEKALSLIKHSELVRERNMWEEAKSKNTVYHFQHYLKESRLKTYADEATKKLYEIEKQQEENELQKESKQETVASDFLTVQKASYTSVPKNSNTSFLPAKNAFAKNSTKPSRKFPRKTKIYTALSSILSVLLITAGLAMWIPSGSVPTRDYEGVDSIIIPAMKSGDLVTAAVSDSIKVEDSVNDGSTEGQQSVDNNVVVSSDNHENDNIKEKGK